MIPADKFIFIRWQENKLKKRKQLAEERKDKITLKLLGQIMGINRHNVWRGFEKYFGFPRPPMQKKSTTWIPIQLFIEKSPVMWENILLVMEGKVEWPFYTVHQIKDYIGIDTWSGARKWMDRNNIDRKSTRLNSSHRC